jgi:hypothetical protein
VYRLLLMAYPNAYRREFDEPMAQHFRDQLRTGGRLRFWFRIIKDLIRTAPLRHLERISPRHGHSRFSDDARQAIFFARAEASSFARSEITVEHLLLGLLRNDPILRSKLGPRGVQEVVGRIESSEAAARRVQPMETLPLSQECKLAAGQAVKEAAKSGESRVATVHLVRAILQQETSLASRILRDCGFRL